MKDEQEVTSYSSFILHPFGVRFGRGPPYSLSTMPPRTAAASWSITMIPKRSHLRALLTVALLTVCVGQSPAEERYVRTLRGTALILTPTGTGTGWVIDLDKGILVTNEHVVTTHEQVEVIFPAYDKDGRPVAERSHYQRHGQRFAAEVIDADGQRDLAIIRLKERPSDGIAVVKLAEREPRPGDRVHSIGNPDASDALWVYSAGTVRQV